MFKWLLWLLDLKQKEMKHKYVLFRSVILALVLCVTGVSKVEAQLIVTPAGEIPGWNADSLVRNVLMSGGVSISNVEFNGFSDDLECDNIGVFETGATPTNLGIARGLIFATGHVSVAVGPNEETEAAEDTNCSDFYDESLFGLVGDDINDVAVLAFDFVPWDSIVSFNYVFGSEEYPEYVGSQFNDVFGFFVTGLNPNGGNYSNTNVALIPGTDMVVSINNVNDHSNSEYYVDNTNGQTVQYDGFTTVLTVSFKVVPMTQYHIKMGICDVADRFVDSGVFLEANSFTSSMSYAMLLDGMNYMAIPNDYCFCVNHSIDFDVETTWNYDNVKWYFGDGTSAMGRNVQHAYAQEGVYEVKNVLYNPHRAQDSLYLSKVIEVRIEHGSETVFACTNEPFEWHGMQLTEPGIYIDTLESSYGCDSIVTLHLAVGHADTTHLEVTTCDAYPWYGVTYSEPGVYEHLLQNSDGCDSLLVLHLVMDGFFSSEETIETCNSYTWRGQTYTESGNYEEFVSNPIGCDSTFILNLALSYDYVFDTVVKACSEFVWNGQQFFESGVYEYLGQGAHGCDSIVRLDLTLGQGYQGLLHGQTQVVAATNIVAGVYMYYVPDSLNIAPNTLEWSCTNPNWVVDPSDNRYRCELWVTNIGQGTLIAETHHDCDSVYRIDINATWFDVDENEGMAVRIFPNPAKDLVRVEGLVVTKMQVYNAFGQLVKTVQGGNEISVADLPEGVYLLRITDIGGRSHTARVVLSP